MKKIDDILNLLNQQQPVLSNPDELTDRIMDSLPDQDTKALERKPAKYFPLRVASAIIVAAGILLLLMLAMDQDTEESTTPTAQSEIVSEQHEQIVKATRKEQESHALSPAASTTNSRATQTREAIRSPRQTARQLAAQNQDSSASDSLDYYIEQMEQGLAAVSDSCYLAQVERMIMDNEELQRLMNKMTNPKP